MSPTKPAKLTKSAIDSATYEKVLRKQLSRQVASGRLDKADLEAKLGKLIERRAAAYLWDSARGDGLGLRVHPSGKKSFVLTYRRYKADHPRTRVLGEYGKPPAVKVRNPQTGKWEIERKDLTLHRAQSIAAVYKADLRGSLDPFEDQRRAPSESAPATVVQLCERWLEQWAKRNEASYGENKRRIDNRITPAFGDTPIDRLSREQVDELFSEIGKSAKYEANRVINLLAGVYSWAIETKGYLPEGFKNPAKRTKRERNREMARERVVHSDEMPKLIKAIEAERDPYVRGLFTLLRWTGLRRSELLNAKHSHVDRGKRTILLPKTKSGKARKVPLSQKSLELIRSLRVVGRDHIFPAHNFAAARKDRGDGKPPKFTVTFEGKKDVPMSTPRRQWDRIRKQAGIKDLRLHDLRRTVSQEVTGQFGPKAAQKVLGHADLKTTMRHYQSVPEKAQREAIEWISEQLDKDDSESAADAAEQEQSDEGNAPPTRAKHGRST